MPSLRSGRIVCSQPSQEETSSNFRYKLTLISVISYVAYEFPFLRNQRIQGETTSFFIPLNSYECELHKKYLTLIDLYHQKSLRFPSIIQNITFPIQHRELPHNSRITLDICVIQKKKKCILNPQYLHYTVFLLTLL